MSLSDVVNGVLTATKLQYQILALATTLAVTPARTEASAPDIAAAVAQATFTSLPANYGPPLATPQAYSRNPVLSYDLFRDGLYVHVPAHVKIHSLPLAVAGFGLYGLAIPATGDVFIREDLVGDERQEVIHHEIGHVNDPNASENENRRRTRTVFGDRATIHHRIGWANY